MSTILDAVYNLDKKLKLYIDQDHEPHEILDQLSTSGRIEKVKYEKQSQYIISFKEDRLCILFENQKPIFVDFLDPQTRKYLGTLSKKNVLCKALGLKQDQIRLIDLTAGFGKDTFVASKFFEKVIWVERNPIVHLLLQDGLRRLLNAYPNLSGKFKLVHSEALDYLKSSELIQDSILYFDFMFADKKTKSNKEMFFLKYITQFDLNINIEEYLIMAQKSNARRSVLKAKSIEFALKPKQQYLGQTVNYYVF
jgi:16S rRNA (guanine1516-N2)-methyltransferase